MIADLICDLYHGTCLRTESAAHRQAILEAAERAGDSNSPHKKSIPVSEDPPLIRLAKVYAAADRFENDAMKIASEKVFQEKILDKNLNLNALIEVARVVYETTPASDEGLRKWVTYLTQKGSSVLLFLDEFNELIEENHDFARDFGTKYARANYVWCPDCKRNLWLTNCQCGFSGICGEKTCRAQDLDRLHCHRCMRRGALMRRPPTETDASGLGKYTLEMAQIVQP